MEKHLIKVIQKESEKLHEVIVGVRRHLHAHPELSFVEYNTSDYIASVLDQYGISYTRNWAKTGIVAMVQGGQKGKTVALRADIDALPIQEENKVPYASTIAGVMHACGHDVHSSSLLGTAIILDKIKDKIKGKYKFIFQPGEEKLPGGASKLIKQGVLKKPAVQRIIGQHVHPPLEVGKVGFCPGMYMASADEIYLEIEGKGGHAALPENCVDTILITSHIITSLQQVVSRRSDPKTPSVLSFGKINSDGGATNVIPDRVSVQGTFRTFDEKWRTQAHKHIKHLATNLAKSMDGKCKVKIKKGYPFLHNNEEYTQSCKELATSYLGASNVVDLPMRMTSEDFSFYSQQIPACFYRLGTGNLRRKIVSPVHTSTFDIDENALGHSTGLMAWLAINSY